MQQAGDDAAKLAKPVANLVINDVAARMNADESFDLAACPLTPARAVELVKLLAEDAISSKQAKEVFAAVLDEDKDPAAIVEERGNEAGLRHGRHRGRGGTRSSPRTPTRWPATRKATKSSSGSSWASA